MRIELQDGAATPSAEALAPPTSDASAAEAFSVAATFCGVPIQAEAILQQFGAGARFGAAEMVRAGKSLGLRVRFVRSSVERLGKLVTPAVVRDREGRHLLLARIGHDRQGAVHVLIQRSGEPPQTLPAADFGALWDGSAVLVARKLSLSASDRPFGLHWFFQAVLRYRRVLSEVLLVSFALQLLGLATPLFFQVMVDKVLVHRSLATLDVVAIGFFLALAFEVILGGLRAYVFSHTTNRIDVELGARLFGHLLRLPLGYFGARRVGDSVARVRELENIRQFLTSSTLTLVLDLFFGVIFLGVIFWYSATLGWLVTAGIPLYALISFFATPVIRERVQEKFRRGAENQAFLVETVSGIETVKAMALEPQMQRRWEEQLAGYVRAAFRVTSLGVVASQSAQFVSRLTTLGILYFGASLVMREKLTIGELVAVNMLANQLSGPVLRLAQLWQDFQQVRVSVDRVGDIMNTAAEPIHVASAAARPKVKGHIQFDGVAFRYRFDAPPALSELSLEIRPGEIVGVVGPSGSGKSTVAKLVQRLHTPEKGRITLDGVDLAVIDPAWLRSQVAVVLQESVLFNASIRENIALSNPNMGMDRVIAAARLAGAHEFISELPQAYETEVGERGASLSGGQRQRIAIARALAADPRVLIFDEATSALDLESEQAIQANMRKITHGRTVIIIAHRLSAVRNANRILTIEAGRVTESGTHAELVNRGGRYSRLWAAQNAGLNFSSIATGGLR